MLFSIGIILTVIMLMLLPDSSFYGKRKINTIFIGTYSIIYFYILQYGLTLMIHPLIVGIILILYLLLTSIYANQMLKLKEVMQSILFIMGPLIVCSILGIENNQYHLADIFVIVFIIAMNQSRFIKAPLLYQENTIEFYGLSTSFHLLVLYIFLGYRKIDMNLNSLGTIEIWFITLLTSLLCCSLAALIGFKLKYISFNKKNAGFRRLTILSIYNFFHVSIAEEIIFRGFIYGYLQQFIGGIWLPFTLTTVLFGCHHISFGGKQMFILSCVAGFFYGLVYILTQNIFAAALIHTIVNIIWRCFFIIEDSVEPVRKINN